jgi:hypothetical protein
MPRRQMLPVIIHGDNVIGRLAEHDDHNASGSIIAPDMEMTMDDGVVAERVDLFVRNGQD